MAQRCGASGSLVLLNVGGQVFQTTLATLQGGSNVLSKMFNGEMEPGVLDNKGRVYIDRDPKHFGVILNCLRCGDALDAAANLLPAGHAEQRELLLEAQYYGCEGLVAALEAAEQERARHGGLELKRLEAAAAIDSKRAAVLQEASDKEVAATEAVQQAQATLTALKHEVQQLLAAPPAERRQHAGAASELKAAARSASQRGLKAVHERFVAQKMQLAVICGRADPVAAAMWQDDVNAATAELTGLLQDIVRLCTAVAGEPAAQAPANPLIGDVRLDMPGGMLAAEMQAIDRAARPPPQDVQLAFQLPRLMGPVLDHPNDEPPGLVNDGSESDEDDGPPPLEAWESDEDF